jgi:hypothetical protein
MQMNQDFIAILQQLAAEQGKEALLNPARCKAFLADYTKGDYKKESRLLLQALEAGVQKAIDTTTELEICKQQQIRVLHEEHFLTAEAAADVVDTLVLVLRGKQGRRTPQGMLCANCGKELQKEWKGCPHCLTPIAKTQQNPPQSEIVKTEEKEYKWSTDGSGGIVITRYCGLREKVIIPSSIQNLPVTIIEGYAFGDRTSLTSVTIPNSVISIGEHAFESCSNLTSVSIPDSVTSIKSSAFEGCTNLASITIPNSVTSIERRAFAICRNLTSISIPNVTSIGIGAFKDCTDLTSISIPNVTNIGNGAFKNCTGLTSITIPNNVTKIGEWAFSCCDSLVSVRFEGTIAPSGFHSDAFDELGDLRDKYLSWGGGAGTYTRPNGTSEEWTKQP